MIIMRVAVASRNGESIAGHIGKCPNWIVFEVDLGSGSDADPMVNEVERIKLPKALIFHYYNDEVPHPLGGCHAVIGASAGDSFINKMRRRGIEAVLTAESDPGKAVADYVRDSLLPPKPRPVGGLICKIRDALASER